MRDIKVISGDLDGSQLKRAKTGKYWSRCDGKADNEEIQEASDSCGKSELWSISARDWERIFGRNK